MRIVLYTGKGGVGKTSIAAASALRAAELGHKTLVISTDAAHSLGDALDTPLGADPLCVAPNLWAQEIDVLKELERHWNTVREWLAALMRWQGADEVVAEEMAVLPGMEELVGLLYITRYHDAASFDALIVDCAPTGETLRLLSFPETARWYMTHLFPISKRTAAALGPIARGVIGIPIPGQRVFDTVQNLYEQLEKMRAILTRPETSSVRLVVNPEKMVVKEAQRTFTYLNLYGYHTDLVVCNRLLPASVQDQFFAAWRESQDRYFNLIQESFSPVPILTAPLLNREVVGLDSLRELAEALYSSQDPASVFSAYQPQRVLKEKGEHVLALAVPFMRKEDLSLIRNGEELVIQAGRYRRHVYLPRLLANLAVKEAQLNEDTLRIIFEDQQTALAGKRARR